MKFRTATKSAAMRADSQPPNAPRRAFLRTTSGIAVGLPFLASLAPKEVKAAVVTKRFATFRTGHGGVDLRNMVPASSVSNEVANLWHPVKHGSLVAGATKAGSDTIVSPVLSGPSTVLTEKLIGKMNVLLGFDIPVYLGHSRGNTLGNFAESDQGPKDMHPLPTIDQLMAWSPRFYASTAGVTQRSVVPLDGISFAWSNPAAQTGVVQRTSMNSNTQTLFDSLFGGVKPPAPSTPAAPKRVPIVDRILENYKSLRSSNRRLSVEDRRRIDDHIAALSELDRRISDAVAITGRTCDAKRPSMAVTVGDGSLAQSDKGYRLLNDVIAMAFACGVTRIASIAIQSDFADYSGSWHQDVAHRHEESGPQALLSAANRAAFQATTLDLASKLDAYEDGPGVSVLDNTLLQWVQESGNITHDNSAMTVVTFGSAGGYFRTGRFVDFRSGKVGQFKSQYGIFYRQWLATALQSMGISPSEFEYAGQPGYGDARGGNGGSNYAPAIFMQSSAPLPLVTNA